MAAILESRSVARLREAKCGLPKKGWQTQCQMVGLSWLKFEFQCSTHSCSSIILNQFLSGHCDPYLIWLVSRPWGGRIQVVRLRRWLALGWGAFLECLGGDALLYAVVCYIHSPQEAGKDTFIHQQESCWVKTQSPSPNPKPCQRSLGGGSKN